MSCFCVHIRVSRYAIDVIVIEIRETEELAAKETGVEYYETEL